MGVYHEEGKYRATIQAVAMTEAKNERRTPQVELTLQLTGYYDQNDQLVQPCQSRFPPRIYIAITEATMGTPEQPGWAAETLKAIGFGGNFDDLSGIEGWEGDVLCQYQDGLNGQQREQWSVLRPDSARQLRPPEAKSLRALNAKFSKLFKPINGQAPRQPARPLPAVTAPPPANNAAVDDEIPF